MRLSRVIEQDSRGAPYDNSASTNLKALHCRPLSGEQTRDLKMPGGDQGLDHLIDGLAAVLPLRVVVPQPHVQRMRLGMLFHDAILLTLDDVICAGAPDVVNQRRDGETGPGSAVRQLDKLIHSVFP